MPRNPAEEEATPLTVTQLTSLIRERLEDLPPCWVKGEVSNMRVVASGHTYFSLKDAGAQLPAVMFRNQGLRQTVKLRDGLQVAAFGKLGVYEPQGRYQLVVQNLVDAGVGDLQRQFEALKRKLSDEGLFDSERKVPLPAMPAVIGFITSPTGAAVQDFLRILIRRGWLGRVVVLPSKVQGEGSAAEMAAMVEFADESGLFDLVVIGRGGGSIEDLWAFNEEVLVRAVAACRTPVISAVGHEIDFTLCDFAADRRAETPTAAAELISSEFVRFSDRTGAAREAAVAALRVAMDRARERLSHGRSRLRLLTPTALVERGYLRLDDMSNRLTSALQAYLHDRRQALSRAAALLDKASPEVRVQIESHRLLALYKRLHGASAESVLNRGFAIVRDENGTPVTRASGLAAGKRGEAEFADGRVPFRVEPTT